MSIHDRLWKKDESVTAPMEGMGRCCPPESPQRDVDLSCLKSLRGVSDKSLFCVEKPILVNKIEIKPCEKRIKFLGENVYLPPKCFRVAVELILNAGCILSRDDLLDACNSDPDHDPEGDRSIDTLIKRIRQCFLKSVPDFSSIDNVYGAGYVWRMKPDANGGASPGNADRVSLVVDQRTREVIYCGVPIHLTHAQFKLLFALARRPGMIRPMDKEKYGAERAILKHIRKCFRDVRSDIDAIRNHYGVGFSLDAAIVCETIDREKQPKPFRLMW